MSMQSLVLLEFLLIAGYYGLKWLACLLHKNWYEIIGVEWGYGIQNLVMV